jgi:hypothetical protein
LAGFVDGVEGRGGVVDKVQELVGQGGHSLRGGGETGWCGLPGNRRLDGLGVSERQPRELQDGWEGNKRTYHGGIGERGGLSEDLVDPEHRGLEINLSRWCLLRLPKA